MMTNYLIDVQHVKRTYEVQSGRWKRQRQEVDAVKDVSFCVKEGEIFGLLGPNGAGKTTMIKMLTTMLIPTSGTISILGLDPVKQYRELRPQINFILGGERNLYWRLSAYDNLAYFADLYKIPRAVQQKRIPQLLQLVGLEDAAQRRVETFSKGMKQRLQIARGLINQPKILFLDEPSIGLDPVSARKLRDILRELNKQGTTIILTTHYMYEADELCDRIAFINKGQLVTIDTPQQLKQKMSDITVITCTVKNCTEQQLNDYLPCEYLQHIAIDVKDQGLVVHMHTNKPQQLVPNLYRIPQIHIQDMTMAQPSLEDVYVAMMGGL